MERQFEVVRVTSPCGYTALIVGYRCDDDPAGDFVSFPHTAPFDDAESERSVRAAESLCRQLELAYLYGQLDKENEAENDQSPP